MFGLLNTKSSISDKISTIIKNNFRACFAGRLNFIDQDGNFNPPQDFWSDEYIAGFINILMMLIVKYDFNGDSFSLEKKGQISILSLMKICGEDWEGMKNILLNNNQNESNIFKKGADEGMILYFAVNNKLKEDTNNPLVKEARMRVEERRKFYLQNLE